MFMFPLSASGVSSSAADRMNARSSCPPASVSLQTCREMFDFPNDMLPVAAEANHLNDQILVRYYESEWKDIAR